MNDYLADSYAISHMAFLLMQLSGSTVRLYDRYPVNKSYNALHECVMTMYHTDAALAVL